MTDSELAEFNKLQAKIKRLREALNKFGRHDTYCNCKFPVDVHNEKRNEGHMDCDCGYSKAIKEADDDV